MRSVIAALQVSIDGFIEGPKGELDWVSTWEDPFGLSGQIDACVLGGGMYLGYEQYWRAILANPSGILSFTGRVPTAGEIEYARFANQTPHFVLTSTLRSVDWPVARIIRSVNEVALMKQQPGKDIYAVGGAAFISSLMNADLIDEIRLVVHPLVLGGGKALFKDVNGRHALALSGVRPIASGAVRLIYRKRLAG
jgi:dihydrofolate reductase